MSWPPGSSRRRRFSREDRRGGRRPSDHDHRQPAEDVRAIGRRLVDRGHRQGSGNARTGARDDARCHHDGCRARASRPRRRAASGDAGHVRPPRLRRLHVDQRPGEPARVGRVGRHAGRGRVPGRADGGLPRSRRAAAGRMRRAPATTSPSRSSAPRASWMRSRSADPSPATTCSRPPSSATIPTGAGFSPRSARRAPPSTPTTSTCR